MTAKAPTALDFARLYPAPAPAGLASEFEFLSPSERLLALEHAHGMRQRFERDRRPVMDPISYLRLRKWGQP